jgi:serine/threonine protein kinase
MLAVREYGPAVDVWAVGCIFGELMGRKPLFPGNDYIHQLRIIQDVVGKPTAEETSFITSAKAMRFMEKQREKEPVPWSKVYPAYLKDPGAPTCNQAFDLLGKMLQFDPRKRCTVEEALAHPYLSTLHHEDDEPSAEQPFKFQFKQTDLTKERLQQLMYEQTLAFHPL